MKKRIAVFFVFALVAGNLVAETQQPATPGAAFTAATGGVPAAATHVPGTAPVKPGQVFGESTPTNGFRPVVGPCQPGTGAQSFNSALGIGIPGSNY